MSEFKKLYIHLLLLLACCSAIAQSPVTRLGIEQGLSNETVRSIYQDKKGFMWFGTLDGLNRFDGYSFKVYHNRFMDTTSLLSSVVYGITEDKAGNLWLGTRLGVCRLNRITDNFTTIFYKDFSGKLIRFDREVIKTIKCDAKNNILIASELQGLIICKDAATIALQIPFVDESNKKSYQYGVQDICFDNKGRTLVFVQGKGLCVLNYATQQLNLLNSEIKYGSSLLPDGDSIWVASYTGVYSISAKTNSAVRHFSVANAMLKADLVTSLSSDGNNIYIGTMGGGLSIYNKRTRQMSHISAGDGNNGLTSSGIYALYTDNALRLWIGTRRGGINIKNNRNEQFVTISHEPGNPNSLSGNFITSVCEMPNGDMWVATEDNGLNLFSKKENRFIHYKYNPQHPGSIAGNNVNNVTIDYLGKVWVATYTDGICRFDPLTRQFKRYQTVNTKTGIENRVFNSFYEDADKTLWASALRMGNFFGALYYYNRQNDVFEMFDDRLSDLFSLKEDSEGSFWGGGLTELVKIDRINRRHEFFYVGQFIRTITDDGMGNLWLGTEGGGLVLFDRKKKKIVARYTTEQGLSNNSIFSTLQDDKGNLWLGTFNGLSRFNIKNRTFKNFYRSDGLGSDQFHFNAATRLSSGAFVFGGIKGYNIFFPDQVGGSAGDAPLRFTDIIIDGKPIAKEPGFMSKTRGSNIAGIAVPYNHAVFTFNFATLEYSVPDKILYAYKMEGWDKGWNSTGNIHTATYTHLGEGSYIFKVRSTNGDGIWKNEISIPVKVFPPWYRSWWAWLFYFSVVAGLVYVYLTYRSRQTKLRYEVNLQKMNLRKEKAERERKEAELALEKAEHEKYAAELETERTQRALEQSERETEKAIADKEREVNERRASFFTSISHEFRTPLTLIINPVKDILQKRDLLPEKEDRELDIVYRNARRMLSLTNQLLLFRREETGLDQLYPVKLNLAALCREVYLCFVQQAQARNIAYHFYGAEKEIEIYGDRDKLEIIFYNLLSNALKYAPESGEVALHIIDADDTVNVKVTDNGPGIAAASREKIFEKFYQAKEPGKEAKPGFGIGLYLAKQFTEAHYGSIVYAERPGGGASFSLTLQKGSAHFTSEQLSYSALPGQSVLHELVQDTAQEEKDVSLLTEVAGNTGHLVASDKQSVLVVDDDPAIREYFKLILEDNYQVFEAVTGEEGGAMAQRLMPDIIVSDIMMEGISGIELCKMIKENPVLNHIPVILITGTSDEAIRLQGIKGGADDYITKPFDKELLLARLSNLLKARNNLQRYFYNEITLSNQDAKIPEDYRQFLEKCIEVVEHYIDDEEFSSKKMAAEMGVSYSSLTKKVKMVSGQSLNAFIRFVRLRKAARLFIDTNYNVNEVAATVGIYDAKYFREQFSKQFGRNPSDFIKKYRKPFSNKFTVNKDILRKGKEEK